jgi:hypothetical protein
MNQAVNCLAMGRCEIAQSNHFPEIARSGVCLCSQEKVRERHDYVEIPFGVTVMQEVIPGKKTVTGGLL